MSLTKEGFYGHFSGRTIMEEEYHREQEREIKVKDIFNDMFDALNKEPKINIRVNEISAACHDVILKGYYVGMILTPDNIKIKNIRSIIESHCYNIEKFFFIEDDEGFTKLEIRVKFNNK